MTTPHNGLPAIHPGEFLRETLDELGLTQAAFANALDISPMRVSHLLKGDRPVTAELALRLGRALGQTPQYWLNLQTAYDLKVAQVAMKDSLDAVQELARGKPDWRSFEALYEVHGVNGVNVESRLIGVNSTHAAQPAP